MNQPLAVSVRLLTWGLLGLCLACVIAGRVASVDSRRVPSPPMGTLITGEFLDSPGTGLYLLDPESGRTKHMPLAGDDGLSCASLSPWKDRRGRRQVVGLGWHRSGPDVHLGRSDFGIARHTLPDGALLDRVLTDVLPNSPPCWMPGTEARIIFAARDGRLYQFAFEGPKELDDGEPHPVPLSWGIDPPFEGRPYISDPSWPLDPHLDGRLLVSLGRSGRIWGTGARLWWLQLDANQATVIAAQPLMPPHSDELNETLEVDYRFPVLTTDVDGRRLVAFLVFREDRKVSQLRVGSLGNGAPIGEPTLAMETCRVLIEDECLPVAPAFSADGRWICCLVRGQGGHVSVRRLPVGNLHQPERTR